MRTTFRSHKNSQLWAFALVLLAALALAPAATADPPDLGRTDATSSVAPPLDRALFSYAAVLGPPAPAVDIASVSKAAASQALAAEGDLAAAASCWVITWTHGRGIWPYNRKVHQRTTWCGNGSTVTYRSSIDWPSHGPACYVEWGPRTYRVGGGVGTFYVDVKTDIGYGCTFVAFDLHDIVWMTIRYNAAGGTRAIAWS